MKDCHVSFMQTEQEFLIQSHLLLEGIEPGIELSQKLVVLMQGSQPGVHVRSGVHLPIRGGSFKVSNRRKKIYLHDICFQRFIHISVNIIFKNHYMLVFKYIYE